MNALIESATFVLSYLFVVDCNLTIAVVVLVAVHPNLGMSLVRSNFHSHNLVVAVMLPSFDSQASCSVRPSACSFADRSFVHWVLASFLFFLVFILRRGKKFVMKTHKKEGEKTKTIEISINSDHIHQIHYHQDLNKNDIFDASKKK